MSNLNLSEAQAATALTYRRLLTAEAARQEVRPEGTPKAEWDPLTFLKDDAQLPSWEELLAQVDESVTRFESLLKRRAADGAFGPDLLLGFDMINDLITLPGGRGYPECLVNSDEG